MVRILRSQDSPFPLVPLPSIEIETILRTYLLPPLSLKVVPFFCFRYSNRQGRTIDLTNQIEGNVLPLRIVFASYLRKLGYTEFSIITWLRF